MEEFLSYDNNIALMNSGTWGPAYNPYISDNSPYSAAPMTNFEANARVEMNSLKVEIAILRAEIDELKKKLVAAERGSVKEHRKIDIHES